jgi:two-component system sensor histidine kinase UhpB
MALKIPSTSQHRLSAERVAIALKKPIPIVKRAEDALRQSEDRLRLVIETIPAMVWTALPDGTVDFVNGRWLDYIGLSWEEFQARGWVSLMHPEDLEWSKEYWTTAVASGQPTQIEHRVRRADGQYRWLLARGVPLRDARGQIVKWYGTATDTDDQRRAQETLRQSSEEIQALSHRLVELQESERKELARELHDRVGQSLTALNINLAVLREGFPHDDPDISSRLDDSATLLESTMQAITNLVSDLRPPMLDDHGLRQALDWYAHQFSARSGIAVSVRASKPDPRVGADVEIALFRVAQEALNNVAKHSRASGVVIALGYQGSEYVMSVADDGVGLGAREGRVDRPALGMVTMRERAQAVGGRFQIESLPGGGTQLTVRISNRTGRT